jgi:hypothetical protein
VLDIIVVSIIVIVKSLTFSTKNLVKTLYIQIDWVHYLLHLFTCNENNRRVQDINRKLPDQRIRKKVIKQNNDNTDS